MPPHPAMHALVDDLDRRALPPIRPVVDLVLQDDARDRDVTSTTSVGEPAIRKDVRRGPLDAL
jgi:hypothetical protein